MRNGMSVSIIVVLLFLLQDVNTEGVVCSSSIDISPSAPHTHAGQTTTPLTISNMELGKTACFTVTDEDSGEKTSYGVKLEGIYSITGWENFYEFALPNVVPKCTCVCAIKHLTGGCEPQDLCESGDDICVTVKKSQKDEQCVGGQAEVCCAIRIDEDLIDNRYVWFKMRSSAVEHMFELVFYKIDLEKDGEEAVASFKHPEIDLEKGQSRAFGNQEKFDIYDVTVEATNKDETTNFGEGGYIGKSYPLDKEVQTYKLDLNLRDGYDIDKAGWAKYQDGKYMINEIQDSEFRDALDITVNSCNSGGKPDITAQFPSPTLKKFTSSLTPLHDKHTAITKVNWHWNDNSTREDGGVKWWYSAGNEITADVKIKMKGKIEVETFSTLAYLGSFTVRIEGTKHGEKYMVITTQGSLGHIYAVYNAQNSNLEKQFDFEITNKTTDEITEKSSQFHCNNEQTGTHGRICFDLNDDQTSEVCVDVTQCNIEEKDRIDDNDSGTETETVVSDDPLSMKSWAKYLNPAEWFKGAFSVQEVVMMVVELIGLCGGIFLVIKVLRMLNLLKKCCRCMFCCCLCPKVEKKVKRKATITRKRLGTAYSQKTRSISNKSVRFKESVRERLTTSAAMNYLRRKMERDKEVEHMMELETGTKKETGTMKEKRDDKNEAEKVNYAYQNSLDHGIDNDDNADIC